MHLTIASKYIKQVLWEMQRETDKCTITDRHFNIFLESGKSSKQK